MDTLAEYLIERIFATINNSEELNYGEESYGNILWYGMIGIFSLLAKDGKVAFGNKTYPGDYIESSANLDKPRLGHFARFVEQERMRSHVLYQNALHAIAQLDTLVEINFPEYKGARLNKNIKLKFLNHMANIAYIPSVENTNEVTNVMSAQICVLNDVLDMSDI